jgi:hypothetical protein
LETLISSAGWVGWIQYFSEKGKAGAVTSVDTPGWNSLGEKQEGGNCGLGGQGMVTIHVNSL